MKIFCLIFSLLSVSYAQTAGDIHFMFIGSSTSDYKDVTTPSQFSSLLNTKYYDAAKKYTVIYFHGYLTKFSSSNVQTIANAYIQRGDHNVIMVDWNKFSSGNYLAVVKNLPNVANFMVNMVDQMKVLGLDLGKVHLIGHSLGAQLSGMIGDGFKRTKNFAFCRITGLGPYFVDDNYVVKQSSIKMPELGPNDAKFVDIIHSDAGGLGTKDGRGHIDFFPNGGRLQPGCQNTCSSGQLSFFDLFKFLFSDGFLSCVTCSHSRAWAFYAESVTAPSSSFPAKKCSTGVTKFTQSNCVGESKTKGYYANGVGSIGNCNDGNPIYGNYFLETNASPPYRK